jgi:mono/diheme cytochrome c family protein
MLTDVRDNLIHAGFNCTLRLLSLAAMVCAFTLVGCEKSPEAAFRFNEVELLKQEKASLSESEHFPESYRQEIGNIVTAVFGTPDAPKFPFLLGEEDDAHEYMSLDNLKLAAGPVVEDTDGKTVSGLYRQHCSHCHGITGDGAGPTADSLNPYPRDFRLGKFKFKATPLRQAPTDQDLTRVLRNGVQGSSMPSFRSLPDSEIQALVDYVKYLTIRGQFERFLIAELSSLDGEPLLDLELVKNSPPNSTEQDEGSEGAEEEEDDSNAEDREAFEEQLDYLIGEGLLETVLSRWVDTEDGLSEVPEVPAAIAAGHADHAALVESGRQLFYAKGNCATCHGETAMGDGQTSTFDDWTNNWIKSAGVDPFFEETYQDFLAAGALKPRPIRPRNLREPIYRGGGLPEDLYLRILNGIEGSPMPAGATLNSDEIWALVAFVKALPFENADEIKPMKVNEKAIAR